MFNLFAPRVPEVSVDEVYYALETKQPIVLLDVREPSEYANKHIHGAIPIPLGVIRTTVEERIPDKTQTIYVYCLSGHRSALAVSEMRKRGYTNVKSMTSGLLAWRPKGYPLDMG